MPVSGSNAGVRQYGADMNRPISIPQPLWTELNLDWSHFRGKRRWSGAQLRQAVIECRSWEEVLTRLGLSSKGGDGQPRIKSRTVRLGLDTSHLNRLAHDW